MTEQSTVIDYLREQGRDPFAVQEDGRLLHEVVEEQVEARCRELGLVPVKTGRVTWDEAAGRLAEVVEWREAPV